MTVGTIFVRSGQGKIAACYWYDITTKDIKHMEIGIDALVKSAKG